MQKRLRPSRYVLLGAIAGLTLTPPVVVVAQSTADHVPVTDAMLQAPAPADWLMWRRTLDGWGYSPLDEIDRDNVGDLRMVWSRAMTDGRQQGTPLVYDGVMYMPNPNDVIQAIDAVTGDLVWEHRREVPEDVGDYIFAGLSQNNRNLAIHGDHIINTSVDDYVFALDATTTPTSTRSPGAHKLRRALTRSGPYRPSPPRLVRSLGPMSSALPPCRSSPPVAASCSEAM